jgi:hypothetical protein
MSIITLCFLALAPNDINYVRFCAEYDGPCPDEDEEYNATVEQIAPSVDITAKSSNTLINNHQTPNESKSKLTKELSSFLDDMESRNSVEPAFKEIDVYEKHTKVKVSGVQDHAEANNADDSTESVGVHR